MSDTSPTVRRRRLGLLLRDLRDGRGLTGEQVGEAVERSASWISRVETGRIGLRLRDLRDLLDLYEVGEPKTRQKLEGLAREGRVRGWWSRYSDSLAQPYLTYIGFEAEATALWFYQNVVVSGLLQTEDYARAIFRHAYEPLTNQVTEDRVKVRMQRRDILLRDSPPQVSVVLEEAVLYRSVGDPKVLREQLVHLVDLAEEGRIKIQIIPIDQTVLTLAVGPFAIIQLGEFEPKVVYIETIDGGTYEERERVQRYEAAYESLSSVALDPTASIVKIKEVHQVLSGRS